MVFGNFHYRNSNCTLFVTLLGVENRIKEKQVSDGGTNDMTRLTPEREADLRSIHEGNPAKGCDDCMLLAEIDALRAERDEAIVGAYRAAADVSITLVPGAVPIHPADYWQEAILDLTPQSALDAVERDRRELVEATILICGVGCVTADDVLAKVGRGR